jgi:hypothetical protein
MKGKRNGFVVGLALAATLLSTTGAHARGVSQVDPPVAGSPITTCYYGDFYCEYIPGLDAYCDDLEFDEFGWDSTCWWSVASQCWAVPSASGAGCEDRIWNTETDDWDYLTGALYCSYWWNGWCD